MKVRLIICGIKANVCLWVAMLSLFFGASHARADGDLVHFQRGKLHLRDGRVEVQFSQARYTFTNIEFVRDNEGDRMNRAFIVYKKKALDGGESEESIEERRIFTVREWSGNSTEVPGVSIARYELGPGRQLFVWAVNNADLDHDRANSHYLFSHEVTASEAGWKFEGGTVAIVPSLPTIDRYAALYVNELGITPYEVLPPSKKENPKPPALLVTVYDESFTTLAFLKYEPSYARQAPKFSLLNHPPVQLFDEIEPGSRISETGLLEYDPQSKTLLVQARLASNESDALTPPPFIIPLEGDTVRAGSADNYSATEDKLDSRLVYFRSLASTRSYLTARRRAEDTLSLSHLMQSWIGRSENALGDIDAPGDTEAILLGIPRIILEYREELSQEVIYQVMENLEDSFSHAGGGHFFYLRLPPQGPRRNALVESVKNELLSRSQSPNGRVQYLLLDARYLKPEFSIALEHTIEAIQQAASEVPGVLLRVITVGHPDDLQRVQTRSDNEKLKLLNCQTKIIGDELYKDEIHRLLAVYLQKSRYRISTTGERIGQFVALVEGTSDQAVSPLDELDVFARRLGRLVSRKGMGLDSEANLKATAQAYLRIAGDRSIRGYSDESIQAVTRLHRAVSHSSPAHLPKALVGLDYQIYSFEEYLLSYLARGSRFDQRFLPFVFLGPPGTGKSLLVKLLRKALKKALVRVVNASDFKPKREEEDRYRMYEPPEERLRDAVEAQIDDMVLDIAHEMKWLIIDEAHSVPAFFKVLLPALGDSDSQQPGVLNLGGLLFGLCLNVNLDSEAYKQLIAMDPKAPGYQALVSTLLAEAISGIVEGVAHNESLDKKTAGAFVSRVLDGAFFFPPASKSKENLEAYADGQISELERVIGIRILVPDDVKETLIARLTDTGDGNYRTGGKITNAAVSQGLVRYQRRTGVSDSELHGKNLILRTTPRGPLKVFDFKEAHGKVGTKMIQEKLYKKIVESTLAVLRYEIDEAQLEGHAEEEIVEGYQAFADALEMSKKEPLFEEGVGGGELKVVPGLDFQLPVTIAPDQNILLTKVVSEAMTELFGQFEADSGFGSVLTTDERPEAVSEQMQFIIDKVALVARTVARARRLEGERVGVPEKPQWLYPPLAKFKEHRTMDDQMTAIVKELEFMETLNSKWSSLLKEVESIPDRAKRAKIARLGSEVETELAKLCDSSPKVSKAKLQLFINHVFDGDADVILADLEAKRREVKGKLVGGKKIELLSLESRFMAAALEDWRRVHEEKASADGRSEANKRAFARAQSGNLRRLVKDHPGVDDASLASFLEHLLDDENTEQCEQMLEVKRTEVAEETSKGTTEVFDFIPPTKWGWVAAGFYMDRVIRSLVSARVTLHGEEEIQRRFWNPTIANGRHGKCSDILSAAWDKASPVLDHELEDPENLTTQLRSRVTP